MLEAAPGCGGSKDEHRGAREPCKMLPLPAPCTCWGCWQGELGAGSVAGGVCSLPKAGSGTGCAGERPSSGVSSEAAALPRGQCRGPGLRRPAAPPAPAPGRRSWLARPRAAESAREDACEPVNDLQICSGIVHAGFACGPPPVPPRHRLCCLPCRRDGRGRWGITAGGTAPPSFSTLPQRPSAP